VPAALAARKFGFARCTADARQVLDDPRVQLVFIATRHDSHAALVEAALAAGKHVFVEKPLALNPAQLEAVEAAWRKAGQPHLMVGFNRRFAPLTLHLRNLLRERSQPIHLTYTVNAGEIPASHWTQDPTVGGGRIIGEACHFIDLLRFLTGHPILGVSAQCLGPASGLEIREDKMTILLTFADASLGTVHYLANGSRSYPKERLEVFHAGRVLVLENFQRLRVYGSGAFRSKRLWRQDKGHRAEIAAFLECIRHGGAPLIPFEELSEVTRATFQAVRSAAGSAKPEASAGL
jgi:predicted dehydrogenase